MTASEIIWKNLPYLCPSHITLLFPDWRKKWIKRNSTSQNFTYKILLWDPWPCNHQCCMFRSKCYVNHISAKLKQNDHPLTNYGHFSDPAPNCITALKMFFYCFLNDTCWIINFITGIDSDRKYWFCSFFWYQNCGILGLLFVSKSYQETFQKQP